MAYALGAVKPHVYRAAQDAGSRFGIAVIYGVAPRDGVSDHPLGLALDFMVYNDVAKGNSVAAFFLDNASYYGVHYIIWQQHIWNRDRSAEGWRAMPNRGSRTANHMDHVHVSFVTTTQYAQIINADDPIAPGPFGPVDPNDPRLPKGIRPPGFDTLAGIANALKQIGTGAKWLTDSHNWLRIGEFILGALLLLLALGALGLRGINNA